MTRREKWRYVRAASRRRVRGREDVAPVPVQQAARKVDDAAHVSAERVRRALAGDRGLLLGLLGIVVLAVLVLVGPTRSFLDSRARVELAQQQLAALDAANAALEQRGADLTDPAHIEVLAREQLGYARPGQVAYSLVPPADDDPVVTPVDSTGTTSSWWDRLRDAFLG
jgi:cell division protein FtsB